MIKAFYYDVVCPYAYMAFSYLKRADTFKRQGIELRPILLGGLFKLQNREPNPNQSMPAVKSAYIRTDIMRQASYFSVPLKFHPRHPVSTVMAMRLIHACDPKQREALSARLYQAYWVDNADIDDPEVIDAIAHEFGMGDYGSYYEESKTSLMEATEQAYHQKVFGVPTIALNHRLYFGADRLVLLENELGIKLPDKAWPKHKDPFDFYFDFSSPYSYLAWKEIKKAQMASVQVHCKPVLLGAIFKEIGMANIPMLNAHPNKTAYYVQDMKDWAEYRRVPFKFNSQFPLRTVTPLRVALIDNNTIDAIFEAAWALDEDVGDKNVLLSVLNRAGFDGKTLLERTEDDGIKDQLKANTAQAVSRGIFGVPAFFINGQLVFGQDRFSWIRLQL